MCRRMGAFRLAACGLAHAGEVGIGCFPSPRREEGSLGCVRRGMIKVLSRGERGKLEMRSVDAILPFWYMPLVMLQPFPPLPSW